MKQTQSGDLPQTEQLIINLGRTISERQKTIAAIKDAMTDAIMQSVELGIEAVDNENFETYTLLYREANFIQHQLNKL